MRVVLIIPTYNERENILALIEALEEPFRSLAPRDLRILVVDDSSPDGTGEVVREAMASHPNLFLLTGEKRGLGAAYVRGIEHALRQLGADAVFEMDADFSHRPEDVPRLLGRLEEGFDFVIGSRYVRGGTVPKEWGLLRRANSFAGNFVARHVAGIRGVRDCTAGFRAIRSALLSRIDLKELEARGYAFQIALLSRAQQLGAKIDEVPVHFLDRTKGQSKLGVRDLVEFVFEALRIRIKKAPRSFC